MSQFGFVNDFDEEAAFVAAHQPVSLEPPQLSRRRARHLRQELRRRRQDHGSRAALKGRREQNQLHWFWGASSNEQRAQSRRSQRHQIRRELAAWPLFDDHSNDDLDWYEDLGWYWENTEMYVEIDSEATRDLEQLLASSIIYDDDDWLSDWPEPTDWPPHIHLYDLDEVSLYF